MSLIEKLRVRWAQRDKEGVEPSPAEIAREFDEVRLARAATEGEVTAERDLLPTLILQEKGYAASEQRIELLQKEISRLDAAATLLQQRYDKATVRENDSGMQAHHAKAQELNGQLDEIVGRLRAAITTASALAQEAQQIAHDIWATNRLLAENGRQDLEVERGTSNRAVPFPDIASNLARLTTHWPRGA